MRSNLDDDLYLYSDQGCELAILRMRHDLVTEHFKFQ